MKDDAAMLPCFKALHWPDYATEIVEDTIDGKPVVIQLWKGWCQQFLSSPDFPGGVGAEVGIYERVTGKSWFPGNSHTPPLAVNYVLSYKINGKSYPRW